MTGTITVVNRFHKKKNPDVIRKMITRTSSPVGNPYLIGTHGDRDEVCDKYEVYIKDLIRKQGEAWAEGIRPRKDFKFLDWLIKRVEEYKLDKDIELVCGCKQMDPYQKCHGDILKKVIIELYEAHCAWVAEVIEDYEEGKWYE